MVVEYACINTALYVRDSLGPPPTDVPVTAHHTNTHPNTQTRTDLGLGRHVEGTGRLGLPPQPDLVVLQLLVMVLLLVLVVVGGWVDWSVMITTRHRRHRHPNPNRHEPTTQPPPPIHPLPFFFLLIFQRTFLYSLTYFSARLITSPRFCRAACWFVGSSFVSG